MSAWCKMWKKTDCRPFEKFYYAECQILGQSTDKPTEKMSSTLVELSNEQCSFDCETYTQCDEICVILHAAFKTQTHTQRKQQWYFIRSKFSAFSYVFDPKLMLLETNNHTQQLKRIGLDKYLCLLRNLNRARHTGEKRDANLVVQVVKRLQSK